MYITRIRVANIVTESIVDGDGLRMVVFVQGCKRMCKGCHNPSLHNFDDGFLMPVERVVDLLLSNPLQSGITFSGGEPLLQPGPGAEIAKKVHENGKNVWCYTGFTYEDLLEDGKDYCPFRFEFLKEIDVLVDGEFKIEERTLNSRFIGSKNQRIIDVRKSLEIGETILYEDNKEKAA